MSTLAAKISSERIFTDAKLREIALKMSHEFMVEIEQQEPRNYVMPKHILWIAGEHSGAVSADILNILDELERLRKFKKDINDRIDMMCGQLQSVKK